MATIHRDDVESAIVLALAAGLRSVGSDGMRTAVAAGLGRLARRFSRAKRESIDEAIQSALGDSTTEQEQREISLGSMAGVWTELFALAAGESARANCEPCKVVGMNRLRSSLAKGNGAILWESNGFGRRWIWKRVLKENGLPVFQVHGPLNLGGLNLRGPTPSTLAQRWLRPLVYRWEHYFVGGIIQLGSDGSLAPLKEMRRRLEGNQIVCISADGVLGDQRLEVEMLGRRVRLAKGLVTLARNSGAPVHSVFCLPTEDGGCETVIEGRFYVHESGKQDKATGQALEEFAHRLDSHVRSRPGLYRNWHQLAQFQEAQQAPDS